MELKENKETLHIVENEKVGADRVEITFYTDPLCCWSWGFEPQWRRLQYEYDGQILFRYVMGGLLPSWNNYNDPMFSVSRPMQMGPVWLEASVASGMPIQDKIWVQDPPASSYPACIAVKAAQLQAPQAGVKYLRMLREAVMLHGKNIAKQDVLVDLAKELSSAYSGRFDANLFEQDLTNEKGLDAFRLDMQEVQNRAINRFPTLIIRSGNNKAVMITGYRPYAVLVEAIKQVAPEIKLIRKAESAEEYKKFWGTVTTREIEEALKNSTR